MKAGHVASYICMVRYVLSPLHISPSPLRQSQCQHIRHFVSFHVKTLKMFDIWCIFSFSISQRELSCLPDSIILISHVTCVDWTMFVLTGLCLSIVSVTISIAHDLLDVSVLSGR